jgi:hypothetical protein
MILCGSGSFRHGSRFPVPRPSSIMPASDPMHVPARMLARFEEITALTDAFAREHLNEEYAEMSRRMAAALARKRPSPLERGQARFWAAGIVHTVGWVNFLGDPATEPYMTAGELAARAGVAASTLAAKTRQIRETLDLVRLEPEWTLPSMLDRNPLAWLLMVDGMVVDAREAPRALQEDAFRQGLIPYIPADPAAGATGAGDTTTSGRRGLRALPASEPEPAAGRVFQLKITLDEVRPAVWRRVLVPEDIRLTELHRIIQAAMGWEDYHLWRFQIGGEEFGTDFEGDEVDPDHDAARTHLDRIASPGDVLLYEYDFGDGWEHRVRVEKALPAEPGRRYPVCVEGARACPPEDCGGPWSYASLLEAIRDPAHPEHDDMLEWVGGDFDPDRFDLDHVNRQLARTHADGPERGGRDPLMFSGEQNGTGADPMADLEAAMRDLFAQAGEMVNKALAKDPDLDDEQLDQLLGAVTAGYNVRPQEELGGLAPREVQRLISADWDDPRGAIRLDPSLPLDAVAETRELHNVRLFLGILADGGPVKATPKGNLPRTFVAAFRERIRWDSADDARWLEGRKVLNEEDVYPLHRARIILDLAGLIKRRKGEFSLTRAGERMLDDAQAGELFATLFRTYFRRFNLAYVDGVEPVTGFQHTVAVTLYRFGQVGGEWKSPAELGVETVLPAVQEEAAHGRFGDALPTIMETRFLRPLARFGLAETQELPRDPGSWRDNVRYRKSPLFDRFLSFRIE